MGTTTKAKAADGHELDVYRAAPSGKARGGLVIAQEIFGVNSHIRAVCDGYAADGYLVVAPALFDRVERGVELGYDSDDIARGRKLREPIALDQALMDMEAAAKEVAAVGRIGVVGYCWGGSIAWVAATRSTSFAATVGYYGGMVPDLAAEQPGCPVQLHFGDQDQSIPLAGSRRSRRRIRQCRSSSTPPGTASIATSAAPTTPRARVSRASAHSPSCSSTSAEQEPLRSRAHSLRRCAAANAQRASDARRPASAISLATSSW